MFAIHQTVTSLQRTYNIHPRTKLYSTLDEPNRMKSTYLTIHPSRNPSPQNRCRLKSVFLFYFPFWKAPVSHPPLPQFNQTFHKKLTGCHYPKYRFSPDIGEIHFKRGLRKRRKTGPTPPPLPMVANPAGRLGGPRPSMAWIRRPTPHAFLWDVLVLCGNPFLSQFRWSLV